MSLVALAMRMSAVRAIESAAIFPEGRAFDSAFLPIDDMTEGGASPFVIASTETIVSSPSGRDINSGDRTIDLILEIALTRPVKIDVPGEGGSVEIALVETDAGLEASIALLERQVLSCLFGRGGGAWGDLFRKLVSQIKETTSRRGVSSEDGNRFAARQLTFSIAAISEPPFGMEIDGASPMAEFIALALADEETASLAAAIKHAIEGKPLDWPEVYTASAVLGVLTEEEASAIGIALVEPEAEPPIVAEIEVDGGHGDPYPITEDQADAQLPDENGEE